MKDYGRIISKIRNTPWLITPESLDIILEIVDNRIVNGKLTDEEIAIRLESTGSRRNGISSQATGGVGIVPIQGPIFGKANMMTEMSGATSLETFQRDFMELANNDKVGSIILDVDSPGGTSDLVVETADMIREVRAEKPVYAVANTYAGSAALWLLTQGTKAYITPSGFAGSIGAYTVIEDQSAKDAKDGRKFNYISAGDFKTEGNPHEELSHEGEEYIQGVINELYTQFVEGVALGRDTSVANVKENYGRGRMLTAKKALEVGMVDGIHTFDSIVGSALLQSSAGSRGHAMVSVPKGMVVSLADDDIVENEHSEPGTGTPPIPREQIPDRGGTGNNDRIDTPADFDGRPVNNNMSEGGSMNEHLLALATRLGITVEDSYDDAKLTELISAKLDATDAQLEPLLRADEDAKKKLSFRQQFPEEATRMEQLEETDRTNRATAFAARYERFQIKDGDTVKLSNNGFSSLVLGDIKESHGKITAGQFQVSDLEAMLNHIGSNGIVQYGEVGSALAPEGEDSSASPKAAFANKVHQLMTQDNLEYKDAIKLAAQQNPALYAAYRSSIPTVTTA